jgi:predicted RNase H-like nuclease (RuvC/YqgF family)
MDGLELFKQWWPYVGGTVGAAFAYIKYDEQKKKDREAADKAAQNAKSELLQMAQQIALQTMESQRKELTEAHQRLDEYMKMERQLRRDMDKTAAQVAALHREIATLKADIREKEEAFKRERERYEERQAQLEGELRQQKQILESHARLDRERRGEA